MKEVVIAKEGFGGALLSPYWIKEFYKRKGINIFIYYLNWDDLSYINVTNDFDFLIKNQNDWSSFEYFNTDMGKEIILNNIEHIRDINGYVYAWLEINEDISREDKDLVAIAKEINNKNIIKVVEIPDDVEYEILDYECAIGEYIREISRTWE